MKSISVLIAEDEPPILRRIARMIEACDPEFFVAGTAADGEKALSLMNEIRPDVLFTDIRMPVIDGMELMDRIRVRYPQCILVVISSFQDFEYVSHAIHVQAIDYILKPVSDEELKDLLGKIKSRIRETVRQKLLTQLSLDPANAFPIVPFQTALEREMLLNICVFLLGSLPPNDEAAMAACSEDLNQLAIGKTANTLQEDQTGFVWEFMGRTAVERILICAPKEENFPEKMKTVTGELQQRTHLPLSCVCCSDPIHMQDITMTAKVLRHWLKSSLRVGKPTFATIPQHVEIPEPDIDPGDSELAQNLFYFLTLKNSGAGEFFALLFRTIEDQDWTQLRIQRLFQSTLNLFRADKDPRIAALAQRYERLFEEAVCSSATLTDLRAAISRLQPEQPHQAAGTVRDVEQYLQDHYAEPVTIQSLSAIFGYVPSYISSIFKQEYALSPTDYLLKLRMDKAKQLMREHPDMLCKEISEAVGYKNQHHFSRVFKKAEGIWPTEYLNQWRTS